MITRPQFERLWEDSTEQQRALLEKHIREADRDSVSAWMKEHPSLELAEKPVSILRELAYRLGIKNYSRKGKLELIQDIQQQEKLYGTQQGVNA